MTTVWHTDIVVAKQGMNVKIRPSKKKCYRVELMPDVNTKIARAARKKFQDVLRKEPRACGAHAVKRQVERAIKVTKARWNRWHKESY